MLLNPSAIPQTDTALFANARQTHRYIAFADNILAQSNVHVEVVYTALNNGSETDFGYRYNQRTSSIDETIVSRFGDGTVLSTSAASSLFANNRAIEDLAHMKFPNSRNVVELYPTCGV